MASGRFGFVISYYLQVHRGVISPPPLGPLCQPPSFLIPYFPFPPSLSLSSLHPFTFPSPALLSLTFPSLPCHEASLQIQLGVWRSAVSYPSGVWGRAPASKAFWLHFEPRKHVWCQQFWFFFVLSNKYKFCHDVLKMSPLGILIRCERSPLWATKPLQVYIGRPYIIFVYWGKCSAWCKVHCPSCAHVSKTNQDGSVITMEQDYEVGVAFLLLHSNPPLDALLGRYLGFKYKMCANINVAFCSTWCQTTAVVNRAQLAADVVNCCKQSATLRTCCSQSSSIVLTMLKSKRRQAGFYLQCKILVSFLTSAWSNV